MSFRIFRYIDLEMKKSKREIGTEKYTRGELSQLARRRMIQKDHGDASKYNRKQKYRDDFDEWYPDHKIT